MKHYFITGTGKGIGKALAEQILEDENNRVTGISRNNSIKHQNYNHITTNLADLSDTESIFFPELKDAEEIVLINNAGVMSEVFRAGKLKNDSIINDFNVNIVSPSVLMNNFIKKYQSYTNKRTILNVSSGAARRATDAWSVYCASKAALDMFSETISIEQTFKDEINRIKIFSVAPGVIDTSMQDRLREVPAEDFSDVDRFLKLKADNQLASPEETAKALLKLISERDRYSEVLLDVRKLN